MGSLSKQILFNAALDHVWKLWADVEKTPEWVQGVKESTITSKQREGTGLAWQEKCFLGSNLIYVDHTVKIWKPMKKAVIESSLPMNGSMTRTFLFHELPEGSRVDIDMEWNLGIAGMIIGDDKLRALLEESFDATAVRWKEKVEAK